MSHDECGNVKPRARTLGLGGLLLTGLLPVVAGCTSEENPSFTIVQAAFADGSGDSCEREVGVSEIFLTEGVLDVDTGQDRPYILYPVVSNNLAASGMGATTELNDITVDGFEVKLEPPPGVSLAWTPGCPGEFDTLAPARIAPGDVASLQADVILPCHTAQIRQLFFDQVLPSDHNVNVRFRAIVRAKGTHGGTEIKSGEFAFPIRVCVGCLQTGLAGLGFSQYNYPMTPPCTSLLDNPFQGNACNVAQDLGPLLCCANGEQILCPAQPMAPPM